MRKLRLSILLAVFVLSPQVAHASWLDWLERLSGPGPFLGGGPDLNLLCFDKTNTRYIWCKNIFTLSDLDAVNMRHLIIVSPELLFKTGYERFEDRPNETGDIRIVRLSALYQFRWNGHLDFGAGGGFMRFSGDGFRPFYRGVLTPISVNVGTFGDSPTWKRLRFFAQENYLPTGFTAADFGSTSSFTTNGGEWLTSVGLNYDFTRR